MHKALMERYYQTYNSEDPEALADFYCEDVELITAQGVQNGREQILDTYRYLISVFHDKMRPVAIDIQGDLAVVDIIDSFTAKQDVEDFLGMSLSKGDTFELNLRGNYAIQEGRFRKIVIEMA